MKAMFRQPEAAFAAMDFCGKGYVLESDLLESKVLSRLKFSVQDVAIYVKHSNLFNNYGNADAMDTPAQSAAKGNKSGMPYNGLNFDNFKKAFFP